MLAAYTEAPARMGVAARELTLIGHAAFPVGKARDRRLGREDRAGHVQRKAELYEGLVDRFDGCEGRGRGVGDQHVETTKCADGRLDESALASVGLLMSASFPLSSRVSWPSSFPSSSATRRSG